MMILLDIDDNGIILAAIAAPHTDDEIGIDLMYFENRQDAENHKHKSKRFILTKSSAQELIDSLTVVVALPPRDAQEHFADNMEEHDPDWDEYEADKARREDGGAAL